MSLAQNAGSFASPVPQALPPYARQASPSLRRALRAQRFGDRYFACLCLALLGYALGGRGFAYWGFNPLFIGEIMLLVGLVAMYRSGMMFRTLGLRIFIPLILFMFWGAVCTIPHLDKYQKDAIRDAVVWGYGVYAFILAALLLADPTRVQKIVVYYRKFVFWFLIIGPITTTLVSFFEEQIPAVPGAAVPIIQVKGGDMCVHLAGVFAYVVALGSGINIWLPTLFVPLNLGLNLQGRAAMVSFCAAAIVTMILRPFHPRAMRIFFVIALGLFFLWASNLRIEKGARELSFNGLIKGFASIVGDSDEEALSGSKEWRLKWWTDIFHYTFGGQYFWMGKGFGINLASDDGYQTDDEESLRSPHNGHMTMLARSGVPGLTLWLTVQATWALLIVRSYFKARKNKHVNWSGLFMFLGAYWAALLANATFDVFIEGPMGGIWLWCIYGAGIGCAHLYKRYPDLLTPPPTDEPIPGTFPVIYPARP